MAPDLRYVADGAVDEFGKPGCGLLEQVFDRGGVGGCG
jgi:hypothetical protein